MKCNLECPYSKPNGRNDDGSQGIICKSRRWYMSDSDDCIEGYTEETMEDLRRIIGKPMHKIFRVFTEIPTNEKRIVNMVTNEQLTLEDACDLLNEKENEIKLLRKEVKR